jgi:hypothetical protein
MIRDVVTSRCIAAAITALLCCQNLYVCIQKFSYEMNLYLILEASPF